MVLAGLFGVPIGSMLLGGWASQVDVDKWLITMVIVFVPKTWGCGTPSKWPFYGL